MCLIEPDGSTDLWHEAPRTARTQHVCDGCHALIRPGAAYLKHFSIFEREPVSETMCSTCWWVRAVFAAAPGHFLCTPSFLWELLQDCVGDERQRAAGREEPTPWAKELAILKRRRRTSPAGRKQLHEKWAYKRRLAS